MSMGPRPAATLGSGRRPHTPRVVTSRSEWMVRIAQPTRLKLLDRLELARKPNQHAVVDVLRTTRQKIMGAKAGFDPQNGRRGRP